MRKSKWEVMQVMYRENGELADVYCISRHKTKGAAKRSAKFWGAGARGLLCIKYKTHFTYKVVRV